MCGRINADHNIFVKGTFKISTKAMEFTVHFNFECFYFVPEKLKEVFDFT